MKVSNKRLYARLLFAALCMVALAFCSSYSLAASLEDTTPQEPTISVPLSDWNQLKSNLTQVDELMSSSNQQLNEAKTLTNKQAIELTELKNINAKQANELTQASQLISEQKNSLEIASTLLDELTNEIKRDKATEQRLKRQRDTWAFFGGITVIAAIFK